MFFVNRYEKSLYFFKILSIQFKFDDWICFEKKEKWPLATVLIPQPRVISAHSWYLTSFGYPLFLCLSLIFSLIALKFNFQSPKRGNLVFMLSAFIKDEIFAFVFYNAFCILYHVFHLLYFCFLYFFVSFRRTTFTYEKSI